MAHILASLSKVVRQKCKKIAQPTFIAPMLATLTQDYFSDKSWIYEKKIDGIRLLAFKKNGSVRLMSRNRILQNNDFPEIVTALEKQKADNFIIDGEVAALDAHGISDFQLLQQRQDTKKIKLVYYIFDLMYTDGHDVRSLPLHARKMLLKKLLRYSSLLTYTEHTNKKGIDFFHYACRHGWEGVMAKNRESTYVSKRSSNWLKFKCVMQQELVIGGYTQPQGSRTDFGALLVGYYARGRLHYAGKVGTGYSQETLQTVGKQLRKLQTKKCSFTDYDGTTKDVQWIKPVLVGEFGFAQWTQNGKLRVGRFKGLRKDKKARDVVREEPRPMSEKLKRTS